MDNQATRTRTGLLQVLLVCSSVLGIAGYLFHNNSFFLAASGVCAAIVAIIVAFTVFTTPKSLLPLYLFYALVCVLLLVIGGLVTRSIGSGLLLGCDFIGIGIALIAWFTRYTHRDLSDWLTPKETPYSEEEAQEWEAYLASLLDDSAVPEERIRAMGEAFSELDGILSGMKKQQHDLGDILTDLKNRERDLRDRAGVVKHLARYMDSGLWKKDFEAEEKGELLAGIDEFGVLSEDGLYNVIQEAEERLKYDQ